MHKIRIFAHQRSQHSHSSPSLESLKKMRRLARGIIFDMDGMVPEIPASSYQRVVLRIEVPIDIVHVVSVNAL